MKTPGPPPTPTSLRLLRGNPGKRRLNNREPDPPVAIPSCPKHLSKVAKHEWKRIAKELKAAGIITELDRACLAGYCDAYATWVEACKQLEQFGMVFKAPSGYPIPSPYLAIRDRSLDQMRAFLTEFGMSPSSRSRVKVANPKQQNLFDDLDDDETN
jgi:P27 family predicted phage terminase small subunit